MLRFLVISFECCSHSSPPDRPRSPEIHSPAAAHLLLQASPFSPRLEAIDRLSDRDQPTMAVPSAAGAIQTPRRKSPRGAVLHAFFSAKAHLQSAAGVRLPVAGLAAAFFVLALFMYGEDLRALAGSSLEDFVFGAAYDELDPALVAAAPHAPPSCDLADGEWVFDNVTFPLYRERDCRFLTQQVTCVANGRPDDAHQRWRWQPRHCDLPLFDARVFMEKIRNKRFMFVGDSLNRNQWESLVCLVQPALQRRRDGEVYKKDQRVIFRSRGYNATIEFYWAPFLVESNSDNPEIHSIEHRIIRADSVGRHARNWRGVDYLVFNTYIWWMNTLKMKIRRPGSRDWAEHDEVVRLEAYGRVLRTWSEWVEASVDPSATSVFFVTISPLHISPKNWGNPDGIKCAKETLPVLNFADPLYLGTDMQMYNLVKNVTTTAARRVPVTLIDITKMSEYRKDAHTSVYSIRQGKLLMPEQKADPATYADCIHWCLPGVPDTWNMILYSRILGKHGSQNDGVE